jgi:hypothetical protein
MRIIAQIMTYGAECTDRADLFGSAGAFAS